MDYTIAEDFELPSKGLIYDKAVNPKVRVKSMTTRDEMKRLAPSSTPYKTLADIIENCLVEKPAIHVYDMCLGDYEFLLHKMRIVSYGSDYKMGLICPSCGHMVDVTFNLDDIELREFDEADFNASLELDLPMLQRRVKLQYQTPKILDNISVRAATLKKRFPTSNVDFELQATLEFAIDSIDGEKLSPKEREGFIDNLPVKDMNLIMNRLQEINRKVGLKTDNIAVTCPDCRYEVNTFFRFGPEFFRPTNQ